MSNKLVKISRYNIYSCLTIKVDNVNVCFDPAKIRDVDLNDIVPDIIFISHESMDHMDPIQVYLLQKKKNCKIFCSVATAVDLAQYYPGDIDFIDSLQPLMSGCNVVYGDVLISTAQSIHCDYMMPLVFKLIFSKQNISLINCFDSHLSEEIIQLSSETDLGIIPVGIAKGVNPVSAKIFANKLHSKKFLTNHFKDKQQLQEFNKIIQTVDDSSQYILLDWNKSCEVEFTPSSKLIEKENTISDLYNISINDFCDFILSREKITSDILKVYLVRMNESRNKLLQDKILIRLYSNYSNLSEEAKTVLLVIYTVITLLDPTILNKAIINNLNEDLLSKSTDKVNSLKVVVLFFLGVYSQQTASCSYLENIDFITTDEFEHVNYWLVEFLGRSATSRGKDCQKAMEALGKIINNEKLYNSVVIRRKIFWELFRIAKMLPQIAPRFAISFEQGLADSNPDVRLLAILCFGLSDRIHKITAQQIDKIFDLFRDEEDDVRETAVKFAGMLLKGHKEIVMQNKNLISELLNDSNCHVQLAARQTLNLIPKN
jgi:L-ascorbate metabolism protein UlaG (beta-lactamase superfamily)